MPIYTFQNAYRSSLRKKDKNPDQKEKALERFWRTLERLIVAFTVLGLVLSSIDKAYDYINSLEDVKKQNERHEKDLERLKVTIHHLENRISTLQENVNEAWLKNQLESGSNDNSRTQEDTSLNRVISEAVHTTRYLN